MKVVPTKGEVFFNDLLSGSKASIQSWTGFLEDVISRLTGGRVILRTKPLRSRLSWPLFTTY